jgi:hypothetical protein
MMHAPTPRSSPCPTDRRAYARARLCLLGLALVLAAGCEEEPAAEAPEAEAPEADEVDEADEADEVEPSAAPARDTPEARAAGPAPAEATAAALPALPERPEVGCAFGAPVRVRSGPAWVDVAGADEGFLIGGSAASDGGEEAFLVRVRPGAAPRRVARAALEHAVPADHRRAAPTLAVAGERAALALVDGAHRLLVATFDPAAPGALALAPVAEGASLRFAPVLAARDGGWLVAWTDERDTPMRVRGRLLDAAGRPRGEPADLTPVAGGAAAPAFVEGAAPPVLVFVDPREGMSVVHRVPTGPEGFGDTAVARPVGYVAAPPETAAVRLGEVDWLGYTAVGNVATTAVGLVRLEGTAPPAPLVPGTGYGILHVDVARLGDGAVFVADAPQASPPDAPRELHVRAVGPDGALGSPARVAGPSDRAARGRVAVARTAVATTFTGADGTFVAIGRCAPP